jgi:predicted nucleotidyltransferase component of viral defense system
MIHHNAVDPQLMHLLNTLMALEAFDNFALGGGTSIALRHGHRKSVDIDLFTHEPFNSEMLLNIAQSKFDDCGMLNRTVGSLCLVIEDIKVDILLHEYPLLSQMEQLETVRCLSLDDIAAMKINEVTNRGSKKDFSDLLLLHENGISLDRSVELFCRKYGHDSRFLATRSMLYFDDARQEPAPLYLNGWDWPYVEKTIGGIADKLV